MATITLNGKPQQLAEATLMALLKSHNISPKAVAVALNGKVLAKHKWGETTLKPNDKIEVVRAVPGG